jgi:NAD(P)-dependent dehydrogenase (short-subunit alcohol dehydrogenase family)
MRRTTRDEDNDETTWESGVNHGCRLWPGLFAAFMSRDPNVDPMLVEKRLLEATPMGRHGEPEEVAKAALYLIAMPELPTNP